MSNSDTLIWFYGTLLNEFVRTKSNADPDPQGEEKAFFYMSKDLFATAFDLITSRRDFGFLFYLPESERNDRPQPIYHALKVLDFAHRNADKLSSCATTFVSQQSKKKEQPNDDYFDEYYSDQDEEFNSMRSSDVQI